jgi:RNA polymerase sigma factor (sigma-70 family)
MEDTERALLRGCAEGDLRAFEELYAGYYRRLFGFALRVTRRAELVEEIVNDVLLAVWREAGRFDGRSRVSSWIFGIAWRQSLKALERDRRRTALEAEAARDLDHFDPSPGPERAAEARESSGALRRALAALSPEQRAVVELTFFEGLSYPEIAGILDCPVNTVKTRMFHARRRLRELLPTSGAAGAGPLQEMK